MASDGLHSRQAFAQMLMLIVFSLGLLLWRVIFVPRVKVGEGMGKCGLQAFGD